MTLDFNPDDYAVWERASDQVRSRLGKRVTKEAVALEMARAVLDGACSRSRVRHMVVVHVDGNSGAGWYETQRGRLPASAVVIQEAVQPQPATRRPDEQLSEQKVTERNERKPVPVGTLRELQARSGGRCEVQGCGRGAPLHVHHRRAVCEGGGNHLEELELRCSACHAVAHDKDFAAKPAWRRARAQRRARASPS